MKKNKYKKNQNKRKSRHHVIPSSRGGSSKLENIAIIDKRDHQHYHALFYNKTPVEIVECLVEDFWNGKWTYVEKAYNTYLSKVGFSNE